MGSDGREHMVGACFHKAAKAQVPIAIVSFLGCSVMFVFTFLQLPDDDSKRCVMVARNAFIKDLGEYLNPYMVTYGDDSYQCGWPIANTAFRATILVLLATTNVVHVLMRTAVISDQYISGVTFGYFMWMLTMFSVATLDCSSIRVGAGMCSKVEDVYPSASCSSGRFIGLALGDLLLSITAYVLFKMPLSKESADQMGEAAVLTHPACRSQSNYS